MTSNQTVLYRTTHDTGELTGEPFNAQLCQFTGDAQIPSGCTPKVPPTAAKGFVAVYWDASGNPAAWWKDGDWSVQVDQRGSVYWTADRTKHVIEKIGEVPPAGSFSSDPGPSLAQAQSDKLAELANACAAAIESGFSSSALGFLHLYPATVTDQANLNASVTASLMPGVAADWATPFMCSDTNGVWAARSHTAAQIQRVGMDGKAAILSALSKKWALDAKVSAATSVAQVGAIAWPT